VQAAGGNGTYNYQWINQPAGAQVNNIKSGAYTVSATDIKGCTATSTFTLNDPERFTINVEDKTICVGQKYKIRSAVNNGTYSWTSANGFKSTQQEVILTDPGTYTLQVINAQGCFAEDSFELKTSRDLLHADLLMVTEAFERDTVVVIDLSWPLPDASTWIFPTEASIIEQDNQLGYAFISFDKQGSYDVALQANLGECVDQYSQMITIQGGENPNNRGREKSINLIRYFEAYPNPSQGDFSIDAELREITPVRWLLINVEGNKILMSYEDEGKDHYHWQVAASDLKPGTYFLVLKAGRETKAIRMVKG
jgi:Secretion system C-terminal sorting domain